MPNDDDDDDAMCERFDNELRLSSDWLRRLMPDVVVAPNSAGDDTRCAVDVDDDDDDDDRIGIE